MPLAFDHPSVTAFQPLNRAPLHLDGSYFLTLSRYTAARPVGFRFRAHVNGAPLGDIIRAVPPGAPSVVRSAGGSTSTITPAPGPHGFLVLPLMSSPGHDTITYGSGRGAAQYRLWYLRGQIHLRTSGAPSPGNTAWPAAVRELTRGGSGPITQLGHGTCTTDISPQGTLDLIGRRYFGLIEIEGQIEPPDAPGAFTLERYVQTLTVVPPPPTAQPVPRIDTSPAQFLVTDPRPAGGRVYDTDGPGSVSIYTTRRGGVEQYQADFTQRLVVGNNAGYFAAPRLILDQVDWHYAARYLVTSAGDQFMAPQIQPDPAFSFRLG